MVEETKQRVTSAHEPAQSHHGAHEKPNAPYGSELRLNEEQAKRRDHDEVERRKAKRRSGPESH